MELRLAGASTLEEANAILPGWIDRYNARFGVAAADLELAWRPLPGDLEPDSERLDGSRWVEVDGVFHPVVSAPERPATLRRQGRTPRQPETKVVHVPYRPAADHPWCRYPALTNR